MCNYDLNEILKDLTDFSKKKKIVLDTDAFCEKDDQFAIAYSLLLKDTLDVIGFAAAPFINEKSISPEDGMIKSYNEIKAVMSLVDPDLNIPVYEGSRDFLKNTNGYLESPAADNIIRLAKESDERIYFVGIGAYPNMASALLKCPEIKDKIVIVWFATNTNNTCGEYNAWQDTRTAKVIFDSEAPLVIIPVNGFINKFSVDVSELEEKVGNVNKLGAYLYKKVAEECAIWHNESVVISDVAAIASIGLPGAAEFYIKPAPIVVENQEKMLIDESRHPIIVAKNLQSRRPYDDLFERIASVKD